MLFDFNKDTVMKFGVFLTQITLILVLLNACTTTTPNEIIAPTSILTPSIAQKETPVLNISTPTIVTTPIPESLNENQNISLDLVYLIRDENFQNASIWLYSSDTAESSQIFKFESGDIVGDFNVHPNNKKIAVVVIDKQGTSLWEIDLTTGQKTQITDYFAQNIGTVAITSWSPDHKWLYYFYVDYSTPLGVDAHMAINLETQEQVKAETENFIGWSPQKPLEFLSLENLADGEQQFVLHNLSTSTETLIPSVYQKDFISFEQWNEQFIWNWFENSLYKLDISEQKWFFVLNRDSSFNSLGFSPDNKWYGMCSTTNHGDYLFINTENSDEINFKLTEKTMSVGWLNSQQFLLQTPDDLIVLNIQNPSSYFSVLPLNKFNVPKDFLIRLELLN